MKTKVAVDKFLLNCHITNKSPATIREYRSKLSRFARFYPHLPTNPELIEHFLFSLNISPISKLGYYSTLCAFYRYLNKRYKIRNPMLQIIRPKKPKLILPSLDMEQLKHLYSLITNPRERAIIVLLLDTGLRVGELVNLHKDDLGKGIIILHGKTGERCVPISPQTLALLKQTGNGAGIFLGQRGQLTRGGIYRIVRKLLQKAGIEGNKLGPHRIRHAFAKNYLMAGGDLRSLQEILGHSSIKTTEQYLDLTMGDIIRQHHRFSPLQFVERRE